MVAGKVAVDNFDLDIGAIHAVPGLGQVLPVDSYLHGRDVGLRNSVELEKYIAGQNSVELEKYIAGQLIIYIF